MPREIRFTEADFERAFAEAGVDFDSLTEAEWRQFENAFMEGTDWSYVAKIAADYIAWDREEAEFND